MRDPSVTARPPQSRDVGDVGDYGCRDDPGQWRDPDQDGSVQCQRRH